MANISRVQDIIEIVHSKKSITKNPWNKQDSFEEYVQDLVEKDKWPLNVSFKPRVERESKPVPKSNIPIY